MALHVFVAMPYNLQNGIDFNLVYTLLIRPALESEGFEVFRADEEKRVGDIRADMFQELLTADVVVADISIDNPNVWYELGVRHALRARGVITITSRAGPMPFDVYTDRKLRYHLKDGIPDPAFIEKDKIALAQMVNATVNAWQGRKNSPVYLLLPNLQEPDWKTLRVGNVSELHVNQSEWERRIRVAQKNQKPGDILVLAEDAPAQALRLEAYYVAAKALRQLNQPAFALEQADKALAIDSSHLPSRQERGILLGRLHRFEEAKEWLKSIALEHPGNAETCALIGRIEKDAWLIRWQNKATSLQTARELAALEIDLLRESIRAYMVAFREEPGHYYSGINAVTLLHLKNHLNPSENDSALLHEMEGGVLWAVRAAQSKETAESKDFWARATFADLMVLVGNENVVRSAYANAVAAAEGDWFALNATWQQLKILESLNFRPQEVAAALEVLNRALKNVEPPWIPRKVFLFSGHMIDSPTQNNERFPADMEDLAVIATTETLRSLDAGKEDLALCQGACGGDLIFAKAALAYGMKLELRLPFDEPAFLEKSVEYAGVKWVDLYYEVKTHPNTVILIMPRELGVTPSSRNPYERANLWQLYSALAWGIERVRFVTLWDGTKGGKIGGTEHMMNIVKNRGCRVFHIDSNIILQQTRDRRATSIM